MSPLLYTINTRYRYIFGTWETCLCLKDIYRVIGTFARDLEADVPVTRETQNFAASIRELRLLCR